MFRVAARRKRTPQTFKKERSRTHNTYVHRKQYNMVGSESKSLGEKRVFRPEKMEERRGTFIGRRSIVKQKKELFLLSVRNSDKLRCPH